MKADVVKVVGGKYKGRMGVVVCPTEKMYFIRLDSQRSKAYGFKRHKRKKGQFSR
jgi:hypothetical protein